MPLTDTERQLGQLLSDHLALQGEFAGLRLDMAHFAQTHHQAHHADQDGTWEDCTRGLCPGVRRALGRGDDALAPSRAAHIVARRWDALCRCVAEFEPEDMAACAERRDDLDTAIVGLRRALGYPEDGWVPPITFTPAEREAVIRYAINTEALAGIAVPRDVAERACDAAMARPLPNIGDDQEGRGDGTDKD